MITERSSSLFPALLHELAELPEHIAAEAEWLFVNGASVMEAIVLFIINNLYVVFFVGSHCIGYLFGGFRTEYGIGLRESL